MQKPLNGVEWSYGTRSVRLRKRNKQVISVPIDTLSLRDQQYVNLSTDLWSIGDRVCRGMATAAAMTTTSR